MRENMESISVVIPLYNKAPYISRTLESVAAQTYSDFEVWVIDDGSTDEGALIAGAFPDARFHVIRQQRAGASAARNAGIAAARHSLIAFLDADDEWTPDFLETVLRLYHADPQAGLFATAYLTEKDGRFRRPRLDGVPKGAGHIPDYFQSVLSDIPVISSAVMIRREVFDKAGLFVGGARLGEDQDMWCRIALGFPVMYCARPCAVYHLGTKNSVCYDTSVIEEYPVMRTVRDAISRRPQNGRYLRQYLCKLMLDYAVRLIRAQRLDEAAAAMNEAGWRMPSRHIATMYYLIIAWAKKLLRAIFGKSGQKTFRHEKKLV